MAEQRQSFRTKSLRLGPFRSLGALGALGDAPLASRRAMSLERFVAAQDPVWPDVVDELRAGRKRSHWMWFVFPQIAGLGHSAMARTYAIASAAEARGYLAHPVLGPRLIEATETVTRAHGSAETILGGIDAVKLRSSMTLFARVAADPAPFRALPKLGRGAQPEWLGKTILSAAGIRVPDGELARTPDDAVAIAARVGYPVALKAQAAALSHKTEAGGVMLGLADGAALRAAWATMQQNVKAAASGVTLDGGLVEKMSGKGLELMIGAKRDPAWGTVLLLGLGGIWVEALGDVRLLPVDADETQVVEALHKLRAAKLLAGVRGAPPVDIAALAQAVLAIGQLMRTTPAIVEIDVNPLMVHAKGQGATALDALIVAE